MVKKRSKKEKAALRKNMAEYMKRNAGKTEDWKINVSGLPRTMRNAMIAKGAIRRTKAAAQRKAGTSKRRSKRKRHTGRRY